MVYVLYIVISGLDCLDARLSEASLGSMLFYNIIMLNDLHEDYKGVEGLCLSGSGPCVSLL